MSREKQIEEMANDLVGEIEYDTLEHCYSVGDRWTEVQFDYTKTAEHLIDKGYRKASDVAREIGAILSGYNAGNYAEVTLLNKFYELKKEYESESNK